MFLRLLRYSIKVNLSEDLAELVQLRPPMVIAVQIQNYSQGSLYIWSICL